MNNIFLSFDIFPSSKGAATHIAHTLEAVKSFSSSVSLVCLGYSDMPRHQQADDIMIRRCLSNHPNYLKRAELYQDYVTDLCSGIDEDVHTFHFRDIWSGIALLKHPNEFSAKYIYEVNGFASIELPIHYPMLHHNKRLLDHIRSLEDFCLDKCDSVITVSNVNADCIASRGVDRSKITVIPNTAQFNHTSVDTDEQEAPFFLYSGTLSPWQGIETLIKAFAIICNHNNIGLKLACSNMKFHRPVRKLIKKMQLEDRISIEQQVERTKLESLYSKAAFSVAPLSRCDRNELQGCSPLKILESMAAGTPVIASNLSVCREIIDHNHDGFLVTPDSPRALAHAMTVMLDSPELVSTLGSNARNKILESYNKQGFTESLKSVYTKIHRDN